MHLKYKFIVVFLIMCCYQLSFAQENKTKQDSTKMYRKIEKYSKKRKFTKFLHKLIFEPVTKQTVSKKVYQKTIKKSYAAYQCKIIRKINIVTLDPFGYSELDSTKVPKRFSYKVGNSLHYKTRILAIENLLMIKKNTELDSLMVKETERIIRSQRYVRSISITSKIVSKDSVDVFIRVLDAWSFVPDFSTSTSTSVFRLTERNFFGTGHEISGTLRQSLTGGPPAYSASYTIPTILQTFIRTTLSFENDILGQYGKFVNIERPFYSAYTKWAGGLYLDQQYRLIALTNNQLVSTVQDYKYNSQDYWFGHSFQIFKGQTEEKRTTHFFTIARYLNKTFIKQPDIAFDTLRVFSSEKDYLFNIGIASRKYTQDKYLLNFNIPQDVASGFIYNVTSGYQKKNDVERLYLGSRFAIGKYFSFGYLSTNIEYGSFFRKNINEQSALNVSMVYFTNQIESGRWKFRQFIKPQMVIGYNRLATNLDRLSLNGDYGIQGFNNSTLLGTKKWVMSFQTQGYSPWNVWGFRLNPYFSYSMGMLSGADNSFKSSKLLSEVGIGFIVSNDYLVFNSFQFSISFFPSIPGYGDNVLNTNSFKSTDFSLPSYEVAKPNYVPYQ